MLPSVLSLRGSPGQRLKTALVLYLQGRINAPVRKPLLTGVTKFTV